jgi:hypothetical protein
MERCLRGIAAIEAELRSGNTDIMGLMLAFADWHAELQILRDEEHQPVSNRTRHAEGSTENREPGASDGHF